MLKQLVHPAWIAVVVGIGAPFLLGRWSALLAFGLGVAAWIGAAVIVGIVQRMRATRSGLLAQPRSWLGMHLAHFGIAVFVAGVTVVMGYESEQDLSMMPGDTVMAGNYEVTFRGVSRATGPNYEAEVGDFLLSKTAEPYVRSIPRNALIFLPTCR